MGGATAVGVVASRASFRAKESPMLASRRRLRVIVSVTGLAAGGALGVIVSSCTVAPVGTHATATTSYYRDIKPIVDAKCTQCHFEGGIAPFALTSFTHVQGHAH